MSEANEQKQGARDGHLQADTVSPCFAKQGFK